MALTVIQRPQEDLYVEENPTAYDTPYFTSRWNAANLPLVYKISNTKFPVNSEDPIVSVTSVSNNSGFAQLTHASTVFVFLSKGTVKVTGTTRYNGIWTIRQRIDATNIVIDAPFVASETGNVQNYYNNYSTLVKVYAGLPEYHPSNAEKPMTLITDNPITVVPNASNIATIDVASLVKSKLSLNNDYDVNDLDQFTAVFIQYAEQYDSSDGNVVSVTTTLFTEDVIEGCDPSAGDFVTNGTFTTSLAPWQNVGVGNDWVIDTNQALSTLTSASRFSKILRQDSLGVTDGVEYDISYDYIFPNDQFINVTVFFAGDVVYQKKLSGSGTITFKAIYNTNANAPDYGIAFLLELVTTPSVSISARLDNVTVINALTNPCLAYIFSTHSALQPQSKYGGNIGEYVQNFNGGQFANKWLTLMQKPVLFKGNYFDLSTIIPQSVIQSAVQSGGYFLEIVEYDVNGDVIAENQYPITNNLGDGIYRFRLDNKTFQDKTKEFTAQILRIPVNLFVDGDQGTFDTTSNPTGNPPIDWNLEKDARAIINFEDTIIQAGTGALFFQSRSIFNDDYALFIDKQTNNNKSKVADLSLNNILLGNDFTFEFRFYITSSSQPQFLYSIDTDGSLGRAAIRIIKGTNFLRFQYFNDENSLFRAVDIPININEWYHVVVSWDDGVATNVYVNNVKYTDTRNISMSNSPLVSHLIGNANDTSNEGAVSYFRGLRFYNGYACSDADASNLYNSNPKIVQNVPISMQAFLEQEYLFNQEQGIEVRETENSLNGNLNNGFTNQEASFGGGAWVDVSGL